MSGVCYQINLQRGFGGGEAYTAFFAAALARLGVRTVLFAHPAAKHWVGRLPPDGEVVATLPAELPTRLAGVNGAWVVCHTALAVADIAALKRNGSWVTTFAHMPWHERDPAVMAVYDRVYPVSAYVAATLSGHGLSNVHPEALYGIAALGNRGAATGPLIAGDLYFWDTRKVRDRVLSWGYPLWRRLRPVRPYVAAPDIRLGVVSRLTPIKQFPRLFSELAPMLARFPEFSLDIFGSGGYASVRDLKRVLAPMGPRVRYWGHQTDVAAVYAQLDYLLAGLPEKEALGLNVIEAQAMGVPVLAVDAPPFTETVAPEVTGLLYPDPRRDRGAGFARLLDRLRAVPFRIDAAAAAPWLDRFSEIAFDARVRRMLETLPGGLSCGC